MLNRVAALKISPYIIIVQIIFFFGAFPAFKGSYFQNLFIFTATDALVTAVKSLPVQHYNVDYIPRSFWIIEFILRYFENRMLLKPVLEGVTSVAHLSRVMRKPTLCICENKDADQLRGNREADQRLCFRYICCTSPLLPKSEISSL